MLGSGHRGLSGPTSKHNSSISSVWRCQAVAQVAVGAAVKRQQPHHLQQQQLPGAGCIRRHQHSLTIAAASSSQEHAAATQAGVPVSAVGNEQAEEQQQELQQEDPSKELSGRASPPQTRSSSNSSSQANSSSSNGDTGIGSSPSTVQLLDSRLGSLQSLRGRSRKTSLGGAYTPGEVWHIRRQPAAATQQTVAVLPGLYAGAAVGFGDQQQSQQQQQRQGQGQQQQPQLQGVPAADEDVDFEILDRQASHAAASTSGRHDSSNSSSRSSRAGSDSVAAGEQLQGQQQQQQPGGPLTPGLPALLDKRSRAANFSNSRMELAISRWMKEAPDWFKIRLVYARHGERFNIIHVACALSRLSDTTAARLSHKPMLQEELTAMRGFVGELLHAASDRVPSIDAATAAAVLHSLARLANTGKVPAANAEELIGAILQHIEPYLSSLTARQLTQLVWALKQLQHTPPQSWCESLYAQTHPQLSQLKGFEAALLLRGLAVIKAPIPPAAWSSAVLAQTEELLPGMEPKHISLLLLGVAGLKLQPSRSWLTAAAAALRSKFDQLGPQAMSNVLWAFAGLGWLPDRTWLTAFFSTSLQLLDGLNRHELSMDVWAINKLRLEPGDQWLDEFFDTSEAQLARFALRDLALVGYALAKLGLRPPSTWLRLYCAMLLKHKAGLFHNKTLLTQVMVALDSFKVPRMDMWRREMYAAAGYKLYKHPNWRQRVRVQQGALGAGFSRRRLSRRGSRAGVGARRIPPVLRSGDWGVMDAMGGAGGVLGGSMSSYEELGPAASPAPPAAPAAGAGRSTDSGSGAVKRVLPSTGLVRPQRPAGVGPRSGGAPGCSSSTSSSRDGSPGEASSSLGSV